MLYNAASSLRVIWACMKKDIKTSFKERTFTIVGTLVPLNILFLMILFVIGGGYAPTAVVMNDRGQYAQQFYQAMSGAHSFRLQQTSVQEAEELLRSGRIDVEVNNLNLDFTNDIRRAVPDAITQFYQAQGSSSPVKVTLREQDLRSRDVELFEYSVLPTMVLLLTIGGVINGGVATSREWESRTIKELLLSPTPRSALVTGKVLANFLITFALGVAVLLVGALLGWTQPQGIYWLSALMAIALVALMSSALGVALGAALQRMQPVIAIANSGSVYLFFLAGGIGVLAFAPDWLQNIATFIPLTYGRHALEMAVFYSSSDLLGRDLLVLGASALVAVALGALAMRRGIAS